MFKHCNAVEGKFLGSGPNGPFFFFFLNDKRFPVSSAKSLEIPPPSTKHKRRPGPRDRVSWILSLSFEKA